MKSFTLHTETDDPEEMAVLLRLIADMIDRGYTSGHYPTWELNEAEE